MFKVEKIVLIGPALPFRGGIAQHTTMLKRALAEKNEVLLLSFSRQYPVWLFPGESDRDPAYKNYKEAQTEYVIDSINPLTWIKSVKRVVSFNATMVIIPWWTVFWAPCFGYISGALKRKNIEVVFFCHNVVEHEAAAWKSFLTKNVLKNASRFVVHTKEDKANLERLIPNAEIVVHPHPIYNHFPKAKGILARRKSLELLFYIPVMGSGDAVWGMSKRINGTVE